MPDTKLLDEERSFTSSIENARDIDSPKRSGNSTIPVMSPAPSVGSSLAKSSGNPLTGNTLPRINSGTRGKIFISRPDIPQSALDILKDYEIDIWEEDIPVPRDEFLERIGGVSALFIYPLDRIDAEVFNTAGKTLQVIGTLSAGFDHIDVEEAKRRGVKIGRASKVICDAVAELTIAMLLHVSRRLREGNSQVLKGKWRKWSPLTWMNGMGLKNSIVGIFGLGTIGMEIGRRLVPFKPSKILYSAREENPAAVEIKAEKVKLETLLKESDFVILSCSLNSSTRHIINADKLSLMKSNSILINVSRGEVIDQTALLETLKKKKILGAALDVTSPEPLPKKSPLLKLDNCFILPHLGSAEKQTRVAMAEITSLNIVAGLRGQVLPDEV